MKNQQISPDELLALAEGTVPGWEYSYQVVDLGELVVKSGRLEACDPFIELGRGSVVPVPPGTYPVKVTIADVSDEQDGSHLREAYLSLLVREGTPAAVEFLLAEGEEGPTNVENWVGVPVDCGTVAFVDAEAVHRCMPDPKVTDWYELFDGEDTEVTWFELMDDEDHYREGLANIVLPLAQDGENLVLSHSGWGDGYYPLMGTFDAEGELLAVHIDLEVAERKGEDDDEGDDEGDAGAVTGPNVTQDDVTEEGVLKESWWSRVLGRLQG